MTDHKLVNNITYEKIDVNMLYHRIRQWFHRLRNEMMASTSTESIHRAARIVFRVGEGPRLVHHIAEIISCEALL